MALAGGAVIIHRRTKTDPETGQFLSVDLLLVTPQLEDVWKNRREISLGEVPLCVVSREGLIAMKRIRSSGQDLDDIKKLES